MTSITLEQVAKVYPDGKNAIPGLDLAVADGEFLVLVGPSGCGKSTALRMIAGLEEVSSGRIRFGDREVTSLPAQDRNLAFVFQDYALYPHMTVAQNIGFPLRMVRTPKPEAREKVERAARQLKLTDELGKRPDALSGGQRQRVAMGRAIVREPEVFLMDEPLSNLDAMLRVQMRSEIAALQRELGTTTVYVTHDQVEALTMGHRVAVLRSGVLQQCATPQELFTTPANAFVGGFIGTPQMNFVPAVVHSDDDGDATGGPHGGDGGYAVAFGQVVMFLPADTVTRYPRLAQQHGRTIILGFRPEALLLDPQAGTGTAFDATATAVEHLGNEILVRVPAPQRGVGSAAIPQLQQVTGKEDGALRELVVRLTPRPMSVGEPLRLRIDARQVHLFDESGVALA